MRSRQCVLTGMLKFTFSLRAYALHLMNEFAEDLFNLEADLLLERYKDRWHDDQTGEKALGGLWASSCPILCYGKLYFVWGSGSSGGTNLSQDILFPERKMFLSFFSVLGCSLQRWRNLKVMAVVVFIQTFVCYNWMWDKIGTNWVNISKRACHCVSSWGYKDDEIINFFTHDTDPHIRCVTVKWQPSKSNDLDILVRYRSRWRCTVFKLFISFLSLFTANNKVEVTLKV